MHPWPPRRLTAVPQHWPVRLEILKAAYTPMAEIEQEKELRKRAEVAEAQRRESELQRSCDEAVEALRAVEVLLRKYGFNPDEPRVPVGHREGGQWTDEDWTSVSNASHGVLPDAGPDNTWTRGPQYAANEPPPGIGHNQGRPLDEPPEIPPKLPSKNRLINAFLKTAAYWLVIGISRSPKVRRFLAGLQATQWLVDNDLLPYITSYSDPPKSWEELQQNALSPRRGYDIHHPVEQQAAEDAGFPEDIVDGPGNRLSVPTLKHWQITSWYMTGNKDFGGVSPRTYLRDKDWDERLRVGKMALIRFGVLKP